MAESNMSNVFTMRGWLLKWTNHVKGYKQRWFVLSNGMLLYYRSKEEMAHTCRGTINLLGALIHTCDTCTFVVSNGPSQAFYLKASSEVERQRWVTALELAKSKAIHENELASRLELSDESDHQAEISNVVEVLGNRIESLQTCYALIVKHGNELNTSLSQVEDKKTPDDIVNEIKKINQQATIFRVTSNDMISGCIDYLELLKIKFHKLHQILEDECNQRKRLEYIVDHLITQYMILEKATKSNCILTSDEIKSIMLPIKTAEVSVQDENNKFYDALDTEDGLRESIQVIPSKFGSQSLIAPEVQPSQAINTLTSTLISGVSTKKPLLRRTRIADKPDGSISLWSIMKNCIGKDLSKIPMPVNFSEPLSMLQRIAEDFEYSSILDHAATCKDAFEQLAYIAAFTISNYSTTAIRSAKPFNPLLGETYEFDRTDDLGWRLISEQVSHHPPMAAQHCESKHWTFWQEFTMLSKFRGKYLQVIPLGIAHLVIHNSGNHYTWRKVTTTVHNIIVGTLWVDQHGEMDIINHTDHSSCHLTYLPFSIFKSESQRKVKGCVFDKEGNAKWTVEGKWDAEVKIAPVLSVKGTKDNPIYNKGDEILAWKCDQLPPGSEKYYNLSVFACQLNEIEEGVAPTDSRLRPDQRLMEEGKWDEANKLKVTLEEKQRAVRKGREAAAKSAAESSKSKDSLQKTSKKPSKKNDEGITENDSVHELLTEENYVPYEPTWFKKEVDSTTGKIIHIYKGGYWEAKEKQDWSQCPDIF